MIGRRIALGMVLALGAVLARPALAAEFASDRIRVEVRGQGPDVVLIPGLTSSPRVWQDMVKALPGHRYHLVQVRGFAGHAPEANANGPVAAPVAGEIARYINEAKLDRPAVIGHSMGGTIGMMLAARHPAAVGRLMVVDMLPFLGAVYGPPGSTAESVRPIADRMRAASLAASAEARRKQLDAMIAPMVSGDALRAAALADARGSDSATVANAFHELIVTDMRPELGRIAGPMTVLYVRAPALLLTDAQIDAAYKAAYATAPKATLKRIPESRHFIMYDAPERFHDEVRAFLTAG